MSPKDRSIASTQQKPPDTETLKKSYDEIYTEGWLGKHRNDEQVNLMVKLARIGPGYFLDVACGLGFTLELAEQRGAKAFGLDLSYVPLAHGKQEHPSLVLVQGDGEYLPWPDDTFESIICTGSLEHFVNPQAGMREIARVLKPGGTAAILLPNSHNLQAIYNVIKTGGILPERQEYERFATRLEWEAMLNANGLHVEGVHKFNVGFARAFKKGREGFFYIYNIIYRLLGDFWIPLNLSYNLVYVCSKS
jgi:ubiquinone/menaquinone biosynthesis C-methylase UbiE